MRFFHSLVLCILFRFHRGQRYENDHIQKNIKTKTTNSLFFAFSSLSLFRSRLSRSSHSIESNVRMENYKNWVNNFSAKKAFRLPSIPRQNICSDIRNQLPAVFFSKCIFSVSIIWTFLSVNNRQQEINANQNKQLVNRYATNNNAIRKRFLFEQKVNRKSERICNCLLCLKCIWNESLPFNFNTD